MKQLTAEVSLPLVAPLLLMLALPAGGREPQTPALHWYRGNTHTHTHFGIKSDANGSPAEVARWFKTHGYQFVVVTDHENLTDVAPLNTAYAEAGRFLVLQGQEITQVVADPKHTDGVRHAHVNGINTDHLIMPLLPPPRPGVTGIMSVAATGVSMTQTFQRNLLEVAKAGGIAQINHPNLLWSVELPDLLPLQQPFLLEIWNGYPDSNNLGGTDEAGHRTPAAEDLWDALLTSGKVVWGVGSDDSHVYDQFDRPGSPSPGRAWIVACASELSKGAIVDALKRGHFYASTGVQLRSYQVDATGIAIDIERLPDWSPNLSPTTRYEIRFIGAGGEVLSVVHGPSARFTFTGSAHYVRASIIDSDGRRAWTQPVFRDGRTAAGYSDRAAHFARCTGG